MEKKELKKALEAILFSSGDAVEISRLSLALEVSEEEIKEAADLLIEETRKDDRGIAVKRIGDSYQMCTKKETYAYLLKIIALPKETRLSDAALETLSIIAYKQPITKLEIEKIRGVNTDYTVNRLVELGLAEEKGRLEAPGRPYLFGTTQEFLRHFGLESLKDLPQADPQKEEAFRLEAEEEASGLEEEKKEEQ